MAQTAFAGTLQVHPSNAVEVCGQTDSGREIRVYLMDSELDKLRRAFEFSTKYAQPLGHAYWHIVNKHNDPCDMCAVTA